MKTFMRLAFSFFMLTIVLVMAFIVIVIIWPETSLFESQTNTVRVILSMALILIISAVFWMIGISRGEWD